MTGIQAFLDVLAAAGLRCIFGNPGTTELPLNHALVGDDRFRYYFGIHEIPVTAMADGFASASRQVGVVNLHAACGLGNSMGMLYNAHIAGTPLLITAGQQDRRLRLGEPVLESDLVSVARPWTKWAYEVQRPADIPAAVRRAVELAQSPPTGPVFLSLPVDVQMDEMGPVDPRSMRLSLPIERRVRPPADALIAAADLLSAAKQPVILAGSRVMEAGAATELTALAERLGAPVYAECTTSHGRLPMTPAHPLYRGPLPLWSPDVHKVLAEFDALCVVGMNLLRLYIPHEPELPIPEHMRIVHLDQAVREIGKNHPVDVALPGDPKSGLAELDALVSLRQSVTQVERARESVARCAAAADKTRRDLREQIAVERSRRPMTKRVLMEALARVLPEHIAVVEEAPTTHQNLFERLGAIADPSGFFAHRGWALGWGIGCALGVKTAWPDRPVLGLIGDGSSLYGLQGLWTAAHHQIPVTFVVAKNTHYEILKLCGDIMALPKLRDPSCPGMNLTGPEVDYVKLSEGFGVGAARVDDPAELSDRVKESLAGDRPMLFEVPIERA